MFQTTNQLWFMVDVTIDNWLYKPTNIYKAPHCSFPVSFTQGFWSPSDQKRRLQIQSGQVFGGGTWRDRPNLW